VRLSDGELAVPTHFALCFHYGAISVSPCINGIRMMVNTRTHHDTCIRASTGSAPRRICFWIFFSIGGGDRWQGEYCISSNKEKGFRCCIVRNS
jgi:hypothetical protein